MNADHVNPSLLEALLPRKMSRTSYLDHLWRKAGPVRGISFVSYDLNSLDMLTYPSAIVNIY